MSGGDPDGVFRMGIPSNVPTEVLILLAPDPHRTRAVDRAQEFIMIQASGAPAVPHPARRTPLTCAAKPGQPAGPER